MRLNVSLERLAGPFGVPRGSETAHEFILTHLGCHFGPFGSYVGPFWDTLGPSLAIVGVSGGLGHCGGLLGLLDGGLGTSGGPSGPRCPKRGRGTRFLDLILGNFLTYFETFCG